MRISADSRGHLQSLEHDYVSETSLLDGYKENCGEISASLYNIPSVTVSSAVARRNKSTPTSMRGPGAVPGLFALESAMDELAIALKMDPVDFRILNDTLVDQSSGAPYSSRTSQGMSAAGSGEIWLVQTQPGRRFNEKRR